MTIADLLDDLRRLIASNTVRVLIAMALNVALQASGLPNAIGGEMAQAICSGVDWLLIAAALYFRTRAPGPIRFGGRHRADHPSRVAFSPNGPASAPCPSDMPDARTD